MKTKELYDKYLITGMVAGFEPIEIADATDTKITGTDGKEFLDCFSGISVVNAGHGHPKVVAAAKEQMDKYIHTCTYVYYQPRAGELAQKLAEITPGNLQKSFFGSSGAEAIEGAMRLAKHYTGGNEFVALTNSFHGRTYATLSITGNSGRKISGGPYMPGAVFTQSPFFYRCPWGSKTEEECGEKAAKALIETVKLHTSNNVAAFIAEGLMGEGGLIVPPDNFFPLVKDWLEKEGILFICDEVQSGFGRTGKMFGIDHYGVTPDIMTMAKGIADGFPLSAFTAREEVGNAFTPGSHLSTFGGNAVSCAAAIANIEVLQDGLVENSAARGEQLKAGLIEMQNEFPIMGDVRGRGLMIGVDLIKDAAKTPNTEAAAAIKAACREAGVLIGVGGAANVLRVQPPLTFTSDNVDHVLATIKEAMQGINTQLA
ncbi:MAG: aspartate aminotransferase family protein [Flavobacteriales bacterium]|nr:aspartate aminotransferase family protein [Flavobacteriales bacterium]